MNSYRAVLVFWALLLIATLVGVSVLYPAYGEICEPAKDGQAKECATYGMTLFYVIKIGKFLDAASAAITAIATAVVSWFTYTLWRATDQQRQISDQQRAIADAAASTASQQASDSRAVQRAYVRLSHVDRLNPDNRKLNIEVKNTGPTPAHVMGVKLGYVIVGPKKVDDPPLPPPPVPPYERTVDHPASQAFLHAGDPFIIRQGLDVPQSDWDIVERKEATLYVIGLVEYVDIFGVWHRAGYARRYAPGRAENNLPFVSEGAYSYDIVIQASERLTGKQPNQQ